MDDLTKTLEQPLALDSEPEAPTPAPEELTEKQKRQLRRQYVTVAHGTVRACGHKATFSKDHDPKNNCVHCWAAYLMTSVDLDFIHTVLTTKGVSELIKIKGKKFVRMFQGWLSRQILPALNTETGVETQKSVCE